jgi:hypothetical protein
VIYSSEKVCHLAKEPRFHVWCVRF